MRLNDLLSVGNLFLKLGDKMKSYLKTTAGFVLSATMATASFGATVNVVLLSMLVNFKDLQDHSNL